MIQLRSVRGWPSTLCSQGWCRDRAIGTVKRFPTAIGYLRPVRFRTEVNDGDINMPGFSPHYKSRGDSGFASLMVRCE